MSYGYQGKILWIDLSTGQIAEERLPDEIYQKFLVGYGLAAKVLFDRMKPGVDALGPDNILGFVSGLLIGADACSSGRWTVAGKSPLTGGWGDANCGGYFAPALKKTGYDGLFFTGQSARPVYLLIDDDCAELISADDLWGKDTNETGDILAARHGADCEIACIGQGGENLSLIAGIVTDKGRLAARSGLGAVMGAKNLKAVCLGRNRAVAIYDAEEFSRQTTAFVDRLYDRNHNILSAIFDWMMSAPFLSGPIRFAFAHNLMSQPLFYVKHVVRKWGTSGTAAFSANVGDSPVKNWSGAGSRDFPARRALRVSNDSVTRFQRLRYGCHSCPNRCGGKLTVAEGPYPLTDMHKPQYETLCGFGALILSDDVRLIFKINDLLNRAGIDSISCASVVAWAFEAFEKGVLTEQDTGGLALRWGDGRAALELVRQIVAAEGIGAILKDGVKRAAEHFGRGSDEYAMHVGGQELPMHDPRRREGGLALGVAYEAEPTPGRHMSSLDACDLYRTGKGNKSSSLHHALCTVDEQSPGERLRDASCLMDVVNSLGVCAFLFHLTVRPPIVEWANAATGWEKNFEDYLVIGRRIKTLRHAFNLREGIDVSRIRLPDRARGIPPLEHGPNAGRTPDFAAAKAAYYRAMGWDPVTAVPLPETLDELGLAEAKAALYK